MDFEKTMQTSMEKQSKQVKNIKLPKLQIGKFSGKFSHWFPFWNTFRRRDKFHRFTSCVKVWISKGTVRTKNTGRD